MSTLEAFIRAVILTLAIAFFGSLAARLLATVYRKLP
jgi:hypothetical protein